MVARFQSSVWSPSPRAKQEETLGEPLCWAFRISYTGSKICQTRAAKKRLFTWLAGNLLQIIIHHYPIFSHSGLELSIAMFRLPEGKPDIAQPSLFIFCLRLYSTMISIYAFCIDTCYTVFSFQVPLVIWRFPSSHGTLSHPAMFIGFPWNKPSSDWGIPMTTWNPHLFKPRSFCYASWHWRFRERWEVVEKPYVLSVRDYNIL